MVERTTDVGGETGFDAPDPARRDKPAWYGRLAALNALAIRAGLYTMDDYRARVEAFEPDAYWQMDYYERRLRACEILVDRALAGDELLGEAAGRLASPDTRAEDRMLEDGDVVRVREGITALHARVPRYVHGKVGTIVARRSSRVAPELRILAERDRFDPVAVYRVAFDDVGGTPSGGSAGRSRIVVEIYAHQLEPLPVAS